MRIESMIAGVDFSDAAVQAVTWASEQFAPSASITLVHVLDLPHRPRFARHMVPGREQFEAVAREYAERRMRDTVVTIGHGAPRCEIRVGKPHEAVTALVREIGADLIVIGPHGDRPRPRKLLGTTAERIVRTAPVPVLVVANPPPSRPRKLLVAVDDSSITPTLLTWTRDLAEAFDADVKLLHVWTGAVYGQPAWMSQGSVLSKAAARIEMSRELRESGERWLEQLARTDIKTRRVTAAVICGEPGDVTVEVAAAMQADLIVLGRRGSGLVGPAFLGSTVGTVLHGATCPVLVVVDREASC